MKSNLIQYGLEVPLVVAMAAKNYRLNMNELFKDTKKEPIVEARQYAMYILQTQYGYTQKRAGAVFGKDHATAFHAKLVISQRLKLNQMLYDLKPFVPYVIKKKIQVIHIESQTVLYFNSMREVMEGTKLTEWDIKKWVKNKDKAYKGYFIRRVNKIEERG